MKSSLTLFSVASILGSTQAVQTTSNRLPLFLYVDGGSSASPETIKEEFIKMSDSGVSTIILAFYMTDSPAFPENLADLALTWKKMDAADREDIHQALSDRGTKILMSAGGEAEGGHWRNRDPTEYGTTFCSLAKDWNLDGVDFDLEGISTVNSKVSDWLHKSAKGCKSVFPDAIITSAPQSPYFDPAFGGGSHGHGWDDILTDGKSDGSAHDHLLIQYYNQGSYYAANTYDNLFGTVKPYSIGYLMNTYPDAPSKTFVVGKPFLTSDGSAADWVSLSSLRDMGCRAWKEIHWRGGFMFWQHHFGSDDATFDSYRTLTNPCDGDSDDTTAAPKPTTRKATTTRRTTTTTTTTTPRRTTTTTRAKTTTTTKRTTTKKANTTTTTTPTRRGTTRLPTQSTTSHLRTKTTGRRDTTTTGTTEASSPLIDECKSQIVGVEPQYDVGCQNLCHWYGGDGAPQCIDEPTDSESLMACIINLNSWCRKE